MRRFYPVIALAAVLGALAPLSYAQDPCAGFKWDLARERALFAGTAQPMATAPTSSPAARLMPAHLYALSLTPQAQLQPAAPPGRKARDGTFGGLALLEVPTAGLYRISLDQSGWIDVVGPHGVIAASDFSGAANCNAPHKVVQFELPAGELVLELTDVASTLIKVTITPAGMNPG
jgi:hypothetical protein